MLLIRDSRFKIQTWALVCGVLVSACYFLPSAFCQAGRSNLNGLEARKGRELSGQVAQSQAKTASLTASLTKIITAQGQTTDPKQVAALATRQKQIERDLDQENRHQASMAKQLADWNASTLKTHRADAAKSKIDWLKGNIESK